jgi:hypothetical protein
MRKTHSVLAIILAAAVLATGLAARASQAPETTCAYFNQTGHYVCDEFRDFMNSRGGLEIFGYPLTEAFHDPTHEDLWVQYFQRARMEWHPLNEAPYKVQLGLLADELGHDSSHAEANQIPSSNDPLHHYFTETKHVVSYAFLDYFNSHGGLDIFGYPRSEFIYEGGRVVQYFQRARMEWHPERETGSQVVLTNMGEIYIERFGIPGNWGDRRPPPSTPHIPPATDQGVIELRISASVRYAITGRYGIQTLYVFVDDQQHQPVSGASVSMVARYPSNRQEVRLGPTDESGFTKGSFEILPAPPGERVIIDVTVTYRELKETTQTFFLVWW